jgi:hypothetical protein
LHLKFQVLFLKLVGAEVRRQGRVALDFSKRRAKPITLTGEIVTLTREVITLARQPACIFRQRACLSLVETN